ncbi:MAG TPA: YtcA family lipoprotein [Vicinamibacteria bacterium]
MGPQINVVGSLFPSWMLCATIGILVTLIARRVLVYAGIDPYVTPRPLVYLSLTVLVTLVLWVAYFRV